MYTGFSRSNSTHRQVVSSKSMRTLAIACPPETGEEEQYSLASKKKNKIHHFASLSILGTEHNLSAIYNPV